MQQSKFLSFLAVKSLYTLVKWLCSVFPRLSTSCSCMAFSNKLIKHIYYVSFSIMMLCTQVNYDVCVATLSVCPHRASLKNMPGHGGISRHIFQACPVRTYTQSSNTYIIYTMYYQDYNTNVCLWQPVCSTLDTKKMTNL